MFTWRVNGKKRAIVISATLLSVISVGLVQAGTLRPLSQYLIVQAAIEGVLVAAGGFPDCNENGVDDTQDIADLTSPDCNGNATPDECEINENSTAPGGPFFCTAQCDPDCNHTGVPDDCELFDNDCNGDGRPDECGVFISCDSTEDQELTASDAARKDQFGASVSISGSIVVVGASRDGSAYVYRYDGTNWIEEQKLSASDGGARDQFGGSVSIRGDRIVVGSDKKDCTAGSRCGAAYVYRYDGTNWIEEQKLTASDGAAFDEFGGSVSIRGDTAILGAFRVDCAAGSNCGAAYVYRFNGTNWIEEQKLTASDGDSTDGFGHSVSISGSLAVIGARSADCAAGSNCGSAYVYRFDGTSWIEEQKLFASDASQGDLFGTSVSMSGDGIVVGSEENNCKGGSDCGSAYVYRFDGTNWIEQQMLTASDAAAFDNFGSSVSISGDKVVVGTSSKGVAYVYRFDGTNWIEQQKLRSADAGWDDSLGLSVSISGDTVIAGAPEKKCPIDVTCGDNCGAAHIFELSASDSNCNGLADRCETDCDGNGIADQFEELPDADGDTVPDGCDVCPDDDDTIDGDLDGIPDCTEEVLSPSFAAPPHNIRKNRYISIDPRGAGGFNAGNNFDIRLTLFCTLVNGVTAVGSSWWANVPDANCISIVGPTQPATPPNWDACPTLHLTGCPIIPTSTYDIVAVVGGLASFPPLVAETQAKPTSKWWGDCIGFFDTPNWTPPNGIVGADDFLAAIKTFQDPNADNATHVSVTDMVPALNGSQINRIVNFDDVFSIIKGFQGVEYPGPKIELCP